MNAKMKNTTKQTTAVATSTVRAQVRRQDAASGIPQATGRRDRRKARLVLQPSARVAPPTGAKLSDLPPSKPRDGAEPDHMVKTMVRQLVARGIRLERADTLGDVSAAAFSAFKRRGAPPKGPRLIKHRNGRIYLVDGTGCTRHREATPYRATPGENWRRHLGALAYLADYIDRKVWTILRSPRRVPRMVVDETLGLEVVRGGS